MPVVKFNKLMFYFLFISCFITSNFITAQGDSDNLDSAKMEERIEEQIEEFSKKTTLDELQKALLKVNLMEFNTKALQLFKTKTQKSELKEAMLTLRSKQKEELAIFLDENQIKEFEEYQKKQRRKGMSIIRRQRQRY